MANLTARRRAKTLMAILKLPLDLFDTTIRGPKDASAHLRWAIWLTLRHEGFSLRAIVDATLGTPSHSPVSHALEEACFKPPRLVHCFYTPLKANSEPSLTPEQAILWARGFFYHTPHLDIGPGDLVRGFRIIQFDSGTFSVEGTDRRISPKELV